MRQRVSHPCTKGWQRLKHQPVPTETLLQDYTKDLTLLFWLSKGDILTCSDIKMWKGNVRQMESFSFSSEKNTPDLRFVGAADSTALKFTHNSIL